MRSRTWPRARLGFPLRGEFDGLPRIPQALRNLRTRHGPLATTARFKPPERSRSLELLRVRAFEGPARHNGSKMAMPRLRPPLGRVTATSQSLQEVTQSHPSDPPRTVRQDCPSPRAIITLAAGHHRRAQARCGSPRAGGAIQRSGPHRNARSAFSSRQSRKKKRAAGTQILENGSLGHFLLLQSLLC